MYKLNHAFNLTTCNRVLTALQDDINEAGYVLASKQAVADLASTKEDSRLTSAVVTEYIDILEAAGRVATWRSKPVNGEHRSVRTLIAVISKKRLSRREFDEVVDGSIEEQNKSLRAQVLELKKQLSKR